MNITKPHTHKQLRVHATNDAGRPLCGGGHLARLADAWQTDLAAVNCERCLAIQNSGRMQMPPPADN
jgi:hypothetical protein